MNVVQSAEVLLKRNAAKLCIAYCTSCKRMQVDDNSNRRRRKNMRAGGCVECGRGSVRTNAFHLPKDRSSMIWDLLQQGYSEGLRIGVHPRTKTYLLRYAVGTPDD